MTYTRLNQSLSVAYSNGSVAVNGTYQIPAYVWNKTLLLIQVRRYGYASSLMFDISYLKGDGAKVKFCAGENRYWEGHIDTNGLFTLTAKGGSAGDPYITVFGFYFGHAALQ